MGPFHSAHVACRDNPDKSSLVACGKAEVQTPPVVSDTQSVKPRLKLAMPGIIEQQKRLIEEDLLCLTLTNPVLIRTLAGVSGVPLKALAPCRINHGVYMTHIYIFDQPSNSTIWNWCAVTGMLAQ
jgi:hypothetical protein